MNKNHLREYNFLGDFFMKRYIKVIYIVLTIFMILSNYIVLADDEDEEYIDNIVQENEKKEIEETASEYSRPTINSRKYVIYDRLSGRCIYGKDENKQIAMASTTKIMTILIVLEHCKLTDVVTMDKKAAKTGGSRLGLSEGDKVTVNDLLYGLMLRSGNDAAVALAIHTAGSVEKFAQLMNDKAKELGLKNTHFVTPHGLDNPEHYTTAFELAKLTDYALKNEKVLEIVKTRTTTININGYNRQISNTNELLGNVEGVYGVKTGFTNNAGRCLVTAVKRGDMDLIIVVIGADTRKDRAKDSMKLIEYAYKKYRVVNVEEMINKEFKMWKQINENRIYIYKGITSIETKIDDIKVKKIATDEIPKIEINAVTYLEAPVEKDIRIGSVTVKLGNEVIEEIGIKVEKKVERRNVFEYIRIISNIYAGKINII